MMTHKNIEDVFDEFIPKLEELKRAMDKIKFQIETIHKLFKEIPTVLLGFVTKELRKPFDYP